MQFDGHETGKGRNKSLRAKCVAPKLPLTRAAHGAKTT